MKEKSFKGKPLPSGCGSSFNTTKEYLNINNKNMNIISSIYILTILIIFYNLN